MAVNSKSSDLQLDSLNSPDEDTLEITVRKGTNEVILRDPKDDRIVRLKAQIEEALEESKQGEDIPPLTVEEFSDGVSRLRGLGLTFTPDVTPTVVSKEGEDFEAVGSEEFARLQEQYPTLPYEVGLVAHNAIRGTSYGLHLLGGKEAFEQKARVVRELIIDDEFRADFFFKNALKVPYLENIDWEVVLKTRERGVDGYVGTSYALLMMSLHNTNPKLGRLDLHQNITVAVNRRFLDKTLAALTEARKALDESDDLLDILSSVRES